MQELSPNHWCCYIDGQNIKLDTSNADGISNDDARNGAHDDDVVEERSNIIDKDSIGDDNDDDGDDDHMINYNREQERIGAMDNNKNDEVDIIITTEDEKDADFNTTNGSSTNTKKRIGSSLRNDSESIVMNESYKIEFSRSESATSTESYKRFKSSNSSSSRSSSSSSSDGFTVVVADAVDEVLVESEGVMESTSSKTSTKDMSMIRVNSYTFINSSYYVYDEPL